MPVFTVHVPDEPQAGGDPAASAVFVREGFSRTAFLFPPLWLLWHRRWAAFFIWALILVIAALAVRRFDFHPLLIAAAWLGLATFVGLEAPALKRTRLGRRGFSLTDLAVAETRREAEIAWFARRRPAAPTPSISVAPPARTVPPVGLFPDAAPGIRPGTRP